MQLFITEIASRYPQENMVMVLDGAGRRVTPSDPPTPLVAREELLAEFTRILRHILDAGFLLERTIGNRQVCLFARAPSSSLA